MGAAWPAAGQAHVTPLPLTITPERVEIGLLYDGFDLAVSADAGPGVDVAVLVTGPLSDLVMREQARRWGLFWVPGGEVTFEDVPSLYILRTTVDVARLAPAEVLEGLGIGYEALRSRLGAPVRDDLFHELVVLKESEGLYSSAVWAREGASADRSPFRGVLRIPARAQAQAYSVQLSAFRDGRLVSHGEGPFEVEKAGFVGFVSSLAETHPLAYGLFAVLVAVASGLLVGFFFGSTRKKG
jgi:uncharacterized protein (TIGR02186 family)